MRAQPLGLRSGDRDELESWVRSSSIRAGWAQRARIVLLAADGVSNTRDRRAGGGVPADGDLRGGTDTRRPGSAGCGTSRGPGRPRTVDRARILAATLTPPPKRLGITHWSSRLLAAHLKTDQSTVLRTWRHHRVQPWRAETFKFSTDPELVAKVTDVVGLYLHPPENAIVLCCGREVADPGAGPDAEDAADAAREGRAAHPRLRPSRHHHPVRRAGDRHRRSHRAVPAPAPAPGVPGVPAARRPRLPRPGPAPDHGQLRRPQTPRGQGVAGRQPADPRPLHPDLRILAQPGRGLVRHHRTPGHPPRHLHLGPRAHRRRSATSSTAGTTAANPSPRYPRR